MTETPVPEAEQDVLASLYDLGEGSAREVREHLARRRPLAHSSVVTLLGRLEHRGLVVRRKADEGKAFVYTPTQDRDRAVGPLLAGLVRRLFRGRSTALVASLLESQPPTARELAELEALVEAWRRKSDAAQERSS